MKHVVVTCNKELDCTQVISSEEISIKDILAMNNHKNGELIEIEKSDELFKFAKKLGARLFFKPLEKYKNNFFSVSKVKQAYYDMNKTKANSRIVETPYWCPEEEDMHGNNFL